jgi:hypothetical protein
MGLDVAMLVTDLEDLELMLAAEVMLSGDI